MCFECLIVLNRSILLLSAALSCSVLRVQRHSTAPHPIVCIALQFLCPEKMRGYGGILLTQQGRRFINELAPRDIVAQALLQQPDSEAQLLLGSAAAELVGSSIGFYVSKGFFILGDTLREAAAAAGLPVDAVADEVAAYNAAAACGGPDATGKEVFPTKIDPEAPCYFARVTPVVRSRQNRRLKYIPISIHAILL
jgi:hypothetical protein